MNTNKHQAPQLPQTAVMQSVILPNELRFGIYLQELTSNDVFQVEKAFFTLLELNLECSRPIPLTKEWLLNFGFIQEENEYFFKNETLSISIGVCFYVLSNLGNGEARIKTRNLKYVHQLQNLYFSLTGRELTVA